MAIQKKGRVDFLRDVDAATIDTYKEEPQEELTETGTKTKDKTEVKTEKPISGRRHKNVNNWGRPRKLLVDGVREKSITVQLPENLITYLRKEAKRTKKSMKELIGEPLLEKYMNVIK